MEFGMHSDVALDPMELSAEAWNEIPSPLFEQAEAARLADPPAE
jgi:hypothetical protein